MELLNRLTDDMKAAMKSGQKDRLGVIRMLLSDVRNIDLMPNKPTAEQTVEAYGKKLRKSIEEYEKINKPDEVAKLKTELAVVEGYLPKKASAEDTERLVDEFVSKNSFTEKQVGQAMGMFIKEHGAQVDKARANELLRQKLAGK